MSGFEFPDFYQTQRRRVDEALGRRLPDGEGEVPELLARSMRYTVLSGGKRLRGVLVLETGRLGDGQSEPALEALAAAVELIHAYSLIHDDLPAMDDDEYRRGQPSNHVEFGEDIAILAGDALLNLAYETVGSLPELGLSAKTTLRILQELSHESGGAGLIGGQVLDLNLDPEGTTREDVRQVHRLKTGALMRGAVVAGALAGGLEEKTLDSTSRFGERLGLIFQIKDDLLEVGGEFEQLGKDPDSDVSAGKRTYPALLGVEGTRDLMKEQADLLRGELESMDGPTERLETIVDLIVNRDH